MIDSSAPRTRRALLLGGIGGLAAWAASAVGRAAPVQADGETIHVGDSINTATLTTEIINTTNAATVFRAQSTLTGIGIRGQSDSNIGVLGGSNSGWGMQASPSTNSGIRATSTSGSGVDAESVNGFGVHAVGSSGVSALGTVGPAVIANSTVSHGITAFSSALDAVGIQGYSTANATGVQGSSGSPTGVKPKTGVHGVAMLDAASRGVWGESAAGYGVIGTASSGRGVHGQASTGLGVRGYATSGVGVSGEATTGYALRTTGRVRLDKSAGIATIASGTNNVLVTPGIDLTGTSAVLATLQGSAGGTTTVHRVVIDTTANQFRIYLTANATANVKVAWIVLG